MEKLGNILALWIYKQRTLSRKMESKAKHLSLNGLSALIIIISFIPLTLLFFIIGKNYTWLQISAYYIFQLLLLLIALVFVIGWFKAKEMANADVEGFSFVRLSFKKIDKEFFGFDDSDMENLELLANLLPPKENIVIRELPKNKQSGNLRFLFSF